VMQAHNIAKSLKEITAATEALVEAIPGGLHHGSRAMLSATPPFGLLEVEKIDDEHNTSGVSLTTYRATLTIVVNERVGNVGDILAVFHSYWDRIATMDGLDATAAKFLLIHPEGGDIGEAENDELGKDTILGSSSWIIRLSEHQTELE